MKPFLIIGTDAEDEKFLGAIRLPERIIGIPLDAKVAPAELKLLDRCLKAGWLQFLDVRLGPMNGQMVLARVFYLTDSGLGRLNEIREKKKIQERRLALL